MEMQDELYYGVHTFSASTVFVDHKRPLERKVNTKNRAPEDIRPRTAIVTEQNECAS